MARREWGHNGRGKWCSYKRTTLIVCSINIFVALYVLRNLYTSVYVYPFSDSHTSFRYTSDQIRKMEELNQIRKASEPTELNNLVRQLKKDFLKEEKVVELPQHLKQKLADEILVRLRSLNAGANATVQQEAVESWRKEKLKNLKRLVGGKILNSTILPEEAGIVARALGSDWAELLENFGLWIPIKIINKEHDDKPEGEEEFDSRILPGRQLPLECHAEVHTDYGGDAVRWGLTHHKESAYECCVACLNQAKRAKPGEKRCNIWVYCPSETGCHSPDIYEHKNQECWLKYSKNPKSTFKDRYPESYRNAHPNAPLIVPWVAGVISV
ncbi:uncharacterized protein LOC111408806 [Olea europaea subsp. europaea]|uniref:Uncharacterized protein LOC111408806 n=1 Tax=Olea europaea subsp. europaea TaxID=158383 RepID=A0A8S0P6T3_OLEEU|nr:uncharacterized protein LOC111408806 [Olea europaea subsp. europaea]